MVALAKKTVMTLFSDEQDVYNHQVRIVLAEKDVGVEIYPIDFDNPNEALDDLRLINPYGTVPTLKDRNLVLHDPRTIMEYLDERFPHPPLLPGYPVVRAEMRQMMCRIDAEWYSLVHILNQEGGERAAEARQQLRESLINVAPVFADKPYFLSNEFSLLDCALAPLLWRLPRLGVSLPNSARAIREYAERIFQRPSFQKSLTEIERELRAA